MTEQPRKATLWEVVKSILAAFLGVQSKQKAEHDFQQPSVWVYIAMGVIFTFLFIGTIISIVKLTSP